MVQPLPRRLHGARDVGRRYASDANTHHQRYRIGVTSRFVAALTIVRRLLLPAGAPGEVGTWTPTPGVPYANDSYVLIDHGSYYASKDFYDLPHDRRINWGWATIAGGVQSMARTVTYHPVLKRLVFSPAEEYSQLHEEPPLAMQATATLRPGVSLSLGTWKPGIGNSSDVNVSFVIPTHPTTMFVTVMSGALVITIDYTPGATEVNASIHDCTIHDQWDPRFCRLPQPLRADQRSGTGGRPNLPTAALTLLPTDEELTVRIFTDRTLIEAYWMDGRIAMTYSVPCANKGEPESRCDQTAGEVTVGSTAGGTLSSAQAWAMKSIWVSKETVLATPRIDRQ